MLSTTPCCFKTSKHAQLVAGGLPYGSWWATSSTMKKKNTLLSLLSPCKSSKTKNTGCGFAGYFPIGKRPQKTAIKSPCVRFVEKVLASLPLYTQKPHTSVFNSFEVYIHKLHNLKQP